MTNTEIMRSSKKGGSYKAVRKTLEQISSTLWPLVNHGKKVNEILQLPTRDSFNAPMKFQTGLYLRRPIGKKKRGNK